VPPAIDREGKNIEPVVVTYDIMKLLRLNATLQIKFRVRNPFLILKGIAASADAKNSSSPTSYL
jgi:hypothetical protein